MKGDEPQAAEERASRFDQGTPDPTPDANGTLQLAAMLFILSGAAALVYQVAWQRILALTTGVAVHSIAIITAAFMAGLGIGSHLGGVVSTRLNRRNAVVGFAVLELAVGAFAIASVPIYYHLLYARAIWLYSSLATATVVHFLSLLPPTVLMGMSLPFIVRGLVSDRVTAPRTIGLLYAANALGAGVGAFLTPWLLLRYLGVSGAITVGATGSLLAAVGGFFVSRRVPRDEGHPAGRERSLTPVPADEPAQPFRSWVALYALSGFMSLSLEMVWFRTLDVAAKGAAFTFGTLLAVYLFGLAGGTLAAAGRAATIRRPLAVFLLCQVGIVLATVVAHGLLVWLPAEWPVLAAITEYGKQLYGLQLHDFSLREFLAVYVAAPVTLFGPSTFLMGFGFPVLQRATQTDPVSSGHRVGVLQAANIAGCIVGSLLTGLVLFDLIGTAGVFRGLTLLAAGIALFGLWSLRDRRFVVLAGLLLVIAGTFPDNAAFWRRLHGAPPPEDSFVAEDASSVTALTPRTPPDAPGYYMTINGRRESWLPYGYLHTLIGSVPAVIHPAPEEVAIVGLGSGDTAWAAGCRAETREVVVFEIASSQLQLLLGDVLHKPRMTKLRNFFSDPRIKIVRDDARRRLHADQRKYDMIVADSVDPDLSLSVYIYSVKYFQIVTQRLKPGGLACVYARTPRIKAAIAQVFPHTILIGKDLMVASLEPIEIDTQTWIDRLWSEHVADYLGKPRVRWVRDAHLSMVRPGPAPSLTDEVNRDLEPLDEFVRPR